jgi:hypothetical protein
VPSPAASSGLRMTCLVDADVPRSAADVGRRHGSDAVDGRDITPPPQHDAGLVGRMLPPTATATSLQGTPVCSGPILPDIHASAPATSAKWSSGQKS